MPVRETTARLAEKMSVIRWAHPLLLFLPLWGGCIPESVCGPSTGIITTVIDGDTFELESGVRIRLVLVDTPEITQGKNDCYGHEAADYSEELIGGKTVSLTYDSAQCTDKFGRTLAYVRVGDVELNTELVKRGLACALFIAPAGEARSEEFLTYEAEARTDRIGMWNSCSSIPCAN